MFEFKLVWNLGYWSGAGFRLSSERLLPCLCRSSRLIKILGGGGQGIRCPSTGMNLKLVEVRPKVQAHAGMAIQYQVRLNLSLLSLASLAYSSTLVCPGGPCVSRGSARQSPGEGDIRFHLLSPEYGALFAQPLCASHP
jgi:hypothetical protein